MGSPWQLLPRTDREGLVKGALSRDIVSFRRLSYQGADYGTEGTYPEGRFIRSRWDFGIMIDPCLGLKWYGSELAHSSRTS